MEVCFANPGTTELPLVSAMEQLPEIRPVLGLFEGCCTGAADGYGRMAGKPALVLLHMGPGLANGLANLHNARRAGTPVVTLIGEHATWHLDVDAPLTMDIQALAATVSGWHRTPTTVDTLSTDTTDAITASLSGMVASLIVPHDLQSSPFDGDLPSGTAGSDQSDSPLLDIPSIDRAAAGLSAKGRSVIILGGHALKEDGMKAAARIRDRTGCDLMVETFPARMERGVGMPLVERVPYFPGAAMKALSSYDFVVLAGAREPIAFFGYPGEPSRFLSKEQQVVVLSEAPLNSGVALTGLADALGCKDGHQRRTQTDEKLNLNVSDGPINAQSACAVVAAMQPEHAIVVDESVTSGGAYFDLAARARPHSLLTLTGGALGQGMPCAVGAALACPDRSIINLQADGSALYTQQALWMQARNSLDITTVLFSNRSYDILKLELARAGGRPDKAVAGTFTSIDQPPVDWIRLSTSFGVPASAVHTATELIKQLQIAFNEDGPHMIVVNLVT
jgi:acetolactate synthase-1/2/3 large subunit